MSRMKKAWMQIRSRIGSMSVHRRVAIVAVGVALVGGGAYLLAPGAETTSLPWSRSNCRIPSSPRGCPPWRCTGSTRASATTG